MLCRNCRNVIQLVCTRCGYSRKTGVARATPQDLGLAEPLGPQADVWVGAFGSRRAMDAYFEERVPRDEDAPCSSFAADQGPGVYFDSDFLLPIYDRRQIADVCRTAMGVDSDFDGISAAAARAGLGGHDTVVLHFHPFCDAEHQRSIDGPDHWLRYLGRFEYDPAT